MNRSEDSAEAIPDPEHDAHEGPGHDPDEHESLCHDAAGGSVPALEELVARHLPRLQAYVQLKAGAVVLARESVGDVVQSVCAEMLADRSRFEYRGESRFVHWMCQQALHKIINKNRFHRAQKRDVAREVAMDGPGSDAGGDEACSPLARDLLASLDTPSVQMMNREKLAAFEQAFAELPEDYRTAVTLARIVGLGYAEIAEEMERTEGAVRNLVWRGVARLSSALERLDEGDGAG